MANAPGGRSQTYLVPGENPLDRHARTFAAIEIACLDLIGKATGKPVCDVIGGRVRDEVIFSAYLFYKHGGGGGIGDDVREDEYGEVLSPEACVRECRQMTAQYGFREIKLKGGVLDPADRDRKHPRAASRVRARTTRCASTPTARGAWTPPSKWAARSRTNSPAAATWKTGAPRSKAWARCGGACWPRTTTRRRRAMWR